MEMITDEMVEQELRKVKMAFLKVYIQWCRSLGMTEDEITESMVNGFSNLQ